MWRLVMAAAVLAVAITPARAQMKDAGEIRAELNASAGIPQGELNDGIDGEAVGLTAFFGGPVPGSFLVLGSEIGLMNYGYESRLSVHSTVFDDGIDEDLAVPLEAVHSHASNNVVLAHLVARIEPPVGMVRPYVDVLAGLKYFATRLSVDGDVVVFRNGLDQDAYVADFAFSYGIGGGLRIELYEQKSFLEDRTTHVSLHAGVRYLFGTEGRYVAERSFREEGNRLVVDELSSRTDLLVPQLGISIRR